MADTTEKPKDPPAEQEAGVLGGSKPKPGDAAPDGSGIIVSKQEMQDRFNLIFAVVNMADPLTIIGHATAMLRRDESIQMRGCANAIQNAVKDYFQRLQGPQKPGIVGADGRPIARKN